MRRIKRWCVKIPSGKVCVRETYETQRSAWYNAAGGSKDRERLLRDSGWRVIPVTIIVED
jgi:hypothetical protein